MSSRFLLCLNCPNIVEIDELGTECDEVEWIDHKIGANGHCSQCGENNWKITSV